MSLYYHDDLVTLYHGDCREHTEWLAADVLVTDPPYGIGWSIHDYHGGRSHGGIDGDADTSLRDDVLHRFRDRPAIVFGSGHAAPPTESKQTLVWAKPPDSGIFGTINGWRRDWEAIYLVGPWANNQRAERSSVIRSAAGGLAVYVKRGHPHGKPLDLLQTLIKTCPPGAIADPFAGAGSTLVAAKLLGRRVVGVESDERYCEVAANRLAQDVLPFDTDPGVITAIDEPTG